MFFRYLVELGCIKPLCDLLTVMDSKIVQVALNGLENILRLGEQESKRSGTGINPYCALIEEAYGRSNTPGEVRGYSNGHKPTGVSVGPIITVTEKNLFFDKSPVYSVFSTIFVYRLETERADVLFLIHTE